MLKMGLGRPLRNVPSPGHEAWPGVRRQGPQVRLMQDTKERVALTSIAASAGLAIAKAIVGTMTGYPSLMVEAVHHRVDELEAALKRHWPSTRRVIGHAEPQR